MGMSMHVIGFKAADAKWRRMAAVWNSCAAAKIPMPKEVHDYFGGVDPAGREGMEVHLGDALSKWCREDSEGYEVDVKRLPPDVSAIRFYNSW